jgi:glucose/arabinose dehydrogenase
MVTARRTLWRRWLLALLACTALAACSGPEAVDDKTPEPTSLAQATVTASRPQPTGVADPTPTTPGETPTDTPTMPSAPSTPNAPGNTPAPTDTVAPALATATSAQPAVTPPPPPDLSAIALGLEPVGPAFSQPDLVTHAGDGSGRTFVLEKTGAIRLIDGSPYMDISDRVLAYDLLTTQHELGLVGLAFHPNFEQNRYFYVHYTDFNQDHVVSRFTEGSDGRGDPSSEKILFTYPQPDVNFVGGTLLFGRDGYLYIAMGTGTSLDPDQVVAQQLDNLWGKLLRIDVDTGEPYAIPPDNPFVNTPGARPEIWAYGLRNPWRFAFDPLTNDLYIGGPGEFVREWINFVPGGNAAGLNFGWPILEGDQCWEAAILPCDTAGLELPIIVYERANQNCVVIGGAVYRGASYPVLNGTYLYSDYCSGRIWGAARDAAGNWSTVELLDTQMLTTSFGEDEAGELYVTDGLTGTVYRITASVR